MSVKIIYILLLIFSVWISITLAKDDDFPLTCIEDKIEYCKSKFSGFWFSDGCKDCVCKAKGFQCKTGPCKYHVNNVDEAFDYCDKIAAKNEKLYNNLKHKRANLTVHPLKSLPINIMKKHNSNHSSKRLQVHKTNMVKDQRHLRESYGKKSKINVLIKKLEKSRKSNQIRGRALKQNKNAKRRQSYSSYKYRKSFERNATRNAVLKAGKTHKRQKPYQKRKYHYRKTKKSRKYKYRKFKNNRKYNHRKLSKRKFKKMRKYKYKKSFKRNYNKYRKTKKYNRKYKYRKYKGKKKMLSAMRRVLKNHHKSIKYLRKAVIKNRKLIKFLKHKLVRMMRYNGIIVLLQRQVADLIIAQKRLRLKIKRVHRHGRKLHKNHRLKQRYLKMFKDKAHRKAFLRQMELIKKRQKKFYNSYEKYFNHLNESSKYRSKSSSKK